LQFFEYSKSEAKRAAKIIENIFHNLLTQRKVGYIVLSCSSSARCEKPKNDEHAAFPMINFISLQHGRQFEKSALQRPNFWGLSTPEHPSYRLESKSSDRSDRRYDRGIDETSGVLV
jgi:hypothetical protein